MKIELHFGIYCFRSSKIAVSQVTLYTKQHCAHKRSFCYDMEMKLTSRTNHCRLASREGGVWKNSSLSESFGRR